MMILFCRVGIMQLGILAPYNNLATSMAAAFVPALLVPHQSKSDSKDKPSKSLTKDARQKRDRRNDRIVAANVLSRVLSSCQDNGAIGSGEQFQQDESAGEQFCAETKEIRVVVESDHAVEKIQRSAKHNSK